MDDATAEVSVLYLYPHQIGNDVRNVLNGESPTERLYGLIELQQRKWNVKYSDVRFLGPWARVIRVFRRYGFNPIDPGTIRELKRADVLVVKDDFSLMASIFCRLFGTRLIYLDSMFVLPRHWWRRWTAVLSIRLSDLVVSYSATQVARWSRELRIPPSKFAVLPYTLDMDFYERHRREISPTGDRYVLAVGRDLGRDYRTLIEAARAGKLKLKLVTPPYVLKDIGVGHPDIEVREHLSYKELFSLYSSAAAVVVPIKGGVDYPSGIRAMLEATVLGIPVVVTRTPALAEYVAEGEDVTFVEAGDVHGMKSALLEVVENGKASRERAERTRHKITAKYGMERFASEFEVVLRRCWNSRNPRD